MARIASGAICVALFLAGLCGASLAQDVGEPRAETEADVASGDVDEAEPDDASLTFPRLEGELEFTLQNDLIFDSDERDNEFNNLYGEIDAYLKMRLTPAFSVEAGIIFEQVEDPLDVDDAYFFEREGLYVEQLLARYAAGALELYGGKFNPPFGKAWDEAPGIYGDEFAGDYELTERVGVGGALIFGGEDGIGAAGFGTHRLSANTFFVDTTFLSESVITNRGRTRESDGGAGNTEDFSSFAVTLEGEDIPAVPGLGYNLGFLYQGGGADIAIEQDEDEEFVGFIEAEDEVGLVAGVTAEAKLSERVGIEGLSEVAYLWNAEGLPQDRLVFTTGAAFIIDEKWNVSLAYALRDTDTDNAFLEASTDHLFQLSAGHRWENGISLDIGYVFIREEDTDNHGVGFVLSYETDFSVPRLMNAVAGN